jgi:D-3-phosphoglycerate dehydrogenase / 2-oxoglutarate reductase
MSKTVLVATEKPFAPLSVKKISEICDKAGYRLNLLEKYSDKAALLQAVKAVDALIIRSDKVTEDVLEAAKNLKIVVRAGAGYDNVDCASAAKKNIAVMNTPGQNSNAAAELAFGLMVTLARKQYQGKAGTELKDKKIGVHGYGNIGKCIVKIANGFGMQIEAYGRSLTPGQPLADGAVASRSIEDLYRNCDYISLNLPLDNTTKKLISFELLSKTKKGVTLINTARKEIIDEAGLLRMMEERPDFLYASDIAPDCREEMLEKYPERCFFTLKKMGAQTFEANLNAGTAAVRQAINYLEKNDTTFQVN